MTPGTERSMPRCWMMSVCPIAAIASTAANGSMPCSTLPRRLSGSTTLLTMNSASVAIAMTVHAGRLCEVSALMMYGFLMVLSSS